jgi:hypothetical protein
MIRATRIREPDHNGDGYWVLVACWCGRKAGSGVAQLNA